MLNPEMKPTVLDRSAFLFECPDCRKKTYVDNSFLYHQMEDKIMIHCVNSDENAEEVYAMLTENDLRRKIYVIKKRNSRREGVHMITDGKIKNSNELEFAVFCIENVAAKLGVDAERVYQAFTEKSDILNGYIIPEYEALHTQSREYIVNDLLDVMKERSVEV